MIIAPIGTYRQLKAHESIYTYCTRVSVNKNVHMPMDTGNSVQIGSPFNITLLLMDERIVLSELVRASLKHPSLLRDINDINDGKSC